MLRPRRHPLRGRPARTAGQGGGEDRARRASGAGPLAAAPSPAAFCDCARAPAPLKPSRKSFLRHGHPLSVDADTDALAARDLLVSAAREAGAARARIFPPGGDAPRRKVTTKAGGSPVTDADLAADSLLKRRLRAALPRSGLAFGGDGRRFRAPRAPQPHHRRPDRRHARVHDRRSALGGLGGAHRRRAARSPASSTRRRWTRLTPPRGAQARR